MCAVLHLNNFHLPWFVFVREPSSIPSLAFLYRGPYLVLERKDKYFRLQLGSRTDVVSVDRLKPAFLEDPIQAALPLARGRPVLRPALHALDPPPSFQQPLPPFLHEVLFGRVQIPASASFTYSAESSPSSERQKDLLHRSSAISSGGSTVADQRFSDLPLSIIIC